MFDVPWEQICQELSIHFLCKSWILQKKIMNWSNRDMSSQDNMPEIQRVQLYSVNPIWFYGYVAILDCNASYVILAFCNAINNLTLHYEWL